jgi:hypothetical protein
MRIAAWLGAPSLPYERAVTGRHPRLSLGIAWETFWMSTQRMIQVRVVVDGRVQGVWYRRDGRGFAIH